MSLNIFNSGKKSWQIYVNTIAGISGYDVSLVVSNNNKIYFKKNDVSYTLENFNKQDLSLNNFVVTNSLTANNEINILGNIFKNNRLIKSISQLENTIEFFLNINGAINNNNSNNNYLYETLNDISDTINNFTDKYNELSYNLYNNYYTKTNTMNRILNLTELKVIKNNNSQSANTGILYYNHYTSSIEMQYYNGSKYTFLDLSQSNYFFAQP